MRHPVKMMNDSVLDLVDECRTVECPRCHHLLILFLTADGRVKCPVCRRTFKPHLHSPSPRSKLPPIWRARAA